MVALCNRADHYIFMLWFVLSSSSFVVALRNRETIYIFILFLLLSFFFFFLAYSQQSEIGCLPYFGTWCGPSVNLECRSEICCARLAGNTGRKKSRQKSPSRHHRTTLSGHIFATRACIDNRKKIAKQRYLLYKS